MSDRIVIVLKKKELYLKDIIKRLRDLEGCPFYEMSESSIAKRLLKGHLETIGKEFLQEQGRLDV